MFLDSDLARFYGVSTPQLNRQVRRNPERFPAGFAFRLDAQEAWLVRPFRKGRGGTRHRPWVYSEPGALMLAGVLKSEPAIRRSVRLAHLFTVLREIEGALKTGAHERTREAAGTIPLGG